ncbi:MAG: amidohydrolase [Clostridia bacterium]|nr:amidohydrolase [Clostridia bacterium]
MKHLIKNGTLLLWNGTEYSLEQKELLINNSVIEKIGGITPEDAELCEVTDAENKLIMPGLINLHTHVYMNFMKNSADDLPFNNWLFDRILPIESKLNKDDFYWGTMLGCIEMLRTGTTSYLDMHICENECAQAAMDSGMRAFMGKCIRGEDLYEKDGDFSKALEEQEKYESDLIKFVLSPHSVYACSEKMLSQVADEAEKRNMLKHIHMSESKKEVDDCLEKYGKTPVDFLESSGFLDEKTIAAHCVKLNSNDIDILRNRKVNVATNPSSNAKLCNGIAPVSEMLREGVNVCLGTDSAASNNTLNMFREMNIFSLIHKAKKEDATTLSATEVLKSVSINPAKALGMKDEIGIIREGSKADLIFVDLKANSLFPNNNVVSSLCYSANGSEVESVMVGGKFLMKGRQLTVIDEERVYFEIDKICRKYL